ncbi:kinase-like domain-containing protein [Cantharellus anzutake]|uniref:kinase-like domain-containing protein n=1 Tax=Cantharellus anzutake TaxID=1750568 RepID=UPI00190761CD|nr:kinase-like domain-containing protein [Cantharellus anzutake]KAF8334206.1 kinase-like domain-containing protein [Cantharellus anzutake]
MGSKEHSSSQSSPASLSKVSRQLVAPPSAKKPSPRDSAVGLRKSSAPATTGGASLVPSESHSRFSGLSPSKSLKLLSPRISLATAKTSPSTTPGTPSGSGRQSASTPSPAPSSADDEELLADEEMVQYIKRQQARKLAAGAKKEELDEMLRFPEPLPPVPPSSPTSLLRSSQAAYLSDYEKQEILEFPKIYTIGAHSEKNRATPDISVNNYGYDDDRGDYTVVPHDHLAYRYEIIEVLGKGSFGQVLHCRDHCTGLSVAIKIIRNKKRFHHQALVEIKILDNLRKWDPEEKHHVIKMNEHFYFRDHLCIAMELLSINLYELIKANGFAGFSTVLIRRFTVQMLSALALMRHHRVVHCDLKPENVLLMHPAKSKLKVIDFGSSCFEHEKVYTYIQSRFYRSPEVILGMNYHMAIDMWSLGCILAELYTGYPIFPGENEQEQLSCIMEVLGVPDKDLIARSSRKNLFFDRTGAPRPVVNSRGRRRRPGSKTLAQVLRCDEEHFIDFISKCLHWDPERRLKPQNAMRHPFITAGRRKLVASGLTSSTSRTLLSSSRSTRTVAGETPRRPIIGAPVPLAARVASSNRSGAGSSIPSTPTGTPAHPTIPSSASITHRTPYRSVPTSVSIPHHSSRTVLNGYIVSPMI